MAKPAILFAIAVLLLLLGFSTVRQAQTTQNVVKTQKTGAEPVIEGRPAMWEDPVDLETRDLFYGIGGKKGEPDPFARYAFIERST